MHEMSIQPHELIFFGFTALQISSPPSFICLYKQHVHPLCVAAIIACFILWNGLTAASHRYLITPKINIMAEIDPSGSNQQKNTGVKKGKKLSTRVDLTPMVDLGFLLITFFIFTTTMSQATAMKLIMPKDSTDSTQTPARSSLTFLLSKNNVVYYYQGLLTEDASNIRATSFPGIRSIIIQQQKRLDNPKDLMVIIKPEKESIYKNTVDALDEMTINGVKRYAMVDISPLESRLVEIMDQNKQALK